jgi:hypothetical protein
MKHFKVMREVARPAGEDFAAPHQGAHQRGSIHQDQIAPYGPTALVRLRHLKSPVGWRVASRHEDEVSLTGFA